MVFVLASFGVVAESRATTLTEELEQCQDDLDLCTRQSDANLEICIAGGGTKCDEAAAGRIEFCQEVYNQCVTDVMGAPGGMPYYPEAAKSLKGASGRLSEIGQLAVPGAKSFEETMGGVIKGALVLVGTIFLILMVYGGYIWMLARGDEAAAKKAKDIITMAIIGIIIVLAAYTITYFIVYRLTAATGAGLQ